MFLQKVLKKGKSFEGPTRSKNPNEKEAETYGSYGEYYINQPEEKGPKKTDPN